ncbi:MAG TPA: membrane protein insertase YidC [Alphaproteobacteria bacterium]|nr:membrane protein insertase YidC [Alphaproteobacteria bacterium]
MDNQRNLLLAVVLSIAILVGWQFFFEMPRMERQRALEQAAQREAAVSGPAAPVQGETKGTTPAAPAAAAAGAAPESMQEALSKSPRVKIAAPRIIGSIALKGARVDDIELVNYRASTDSNSPDVRLFAPAGTQSPYFAEFGWVAGSGEKPALPGPDTLWQADGKTLGVDQPVTLTWDNGQGLRFTRTYALDENYMFTVTQRVENYGQTPVTLFPYSLVSRTGTPTTLGYYILHEGPLGVLNGSLHEVKYEELKDKPLIEEQSTGGWIGITDKYWLAAVIPDPSAGIKAHFRYASPGGVDTYQVDFLGAAQAIAPGATADYASRLFAGAKEVRLLDHYKTVDNIDRFDLAVDFGWFYFLTKPIFYVLNAFHGWLGNFGLGILLLTVIIKALFFPLANKSYRAMAKMKALQPEMLRLREQFKDDRVRLNQEMMDLYKRAKANPAAGCLPVVVQIPVFFALYKVLFVTIEMRQAPFYGWIKDLSVPDPTNLLNLFGAIQWSPPDFLQFLAIGIWPILMGITMFLQQRMNPAPPDPIQARIFTVLPIVFTFLLAHFPAGLVIYWAWNNLLSIAQQWVIMRRAEVKKS